MILLSLLPLVAGCNSGSTPLPVGTFVNQSDPAQVLELTLDPSQTPNPLVRMSMETGMNKYFGKSVGSYTLKTQRERNAGTFVWLTMSFRPPDGYVQQVWCTRDTGEKWALTLQPDGSLLDPRGGIWKHLTPTIASLKD
jgi:hypothetical protein